MQEQSTWINVPGYSFVSGSDTRMDQKGNYEIPVNPIPVKCAHCGMPDLDFVGRPYLLTRGFTTPTEMARAEAGNFLVRERVRRLLEIVVPGACEFTDTVEAKSGKQTSWFLAVPKTIAATASVKTSIPRCPTCQEPKVCHPGSHCLPIDWHGNTADIFKSRNWSSGEKTVEDYKRTAIEWAKQTGLQYPWPSGLVRYPDCVIWTRLDLGRELFFSLRFVVILKKVGAKGLYTEPKAERLLSLMDQEWVARQFVLLQSAGLVEANPSKSDGDAARWFQNYMRRKKAKLPKTYDFSRIEEKHELKLPESYKEFIAKVGSVAFEDCDGQDGFTARILGPDRLDFRNYRKGTISDLDEESKAVDGVCFAETGHGDCFVFDVSSKDTDYPVLLYEHELNTFEPYAGNFSECIKRFAQKS